jgi:hypothetical protein
MNGSLKDFLKQRAALYAAEGEKNRSTIEEWRSAVSRLFGQLEAWLDDADPEKIIQRERTRVQVAEPGLGRYEISRLELRAFDKWVGLID